MSPSVFLKFRIGQLCALSLALLVTAATSMAQSGRPAITGSTNALGTVGESFSFGIVASGSPTNYGASNLPPGLLPPAAGSANITGLPQVAGIYTSTMTAANSNGTAATNLFITINPSAPPTLATPSTVFGVQGQPANIPLLSTPNHSNVPTTFSVSGLPSGATLTTTVSANASFPNVIVTNYFINSPSLLTNGSFVVPVVVRNQGGTNTNNITLIINPSGNLPTFSSAVTAAATVGVPFSFDVTALGGPLRYRVTSINATTGLNITNGVLANGLSFANVSAGSALVGRISGTPGTVGTIVLGLEVANNVGVTASTLTITIGNPRPTVVLSQPLGEANYVVGSSFFVNAQVFDQVPDTIVPSSVRFTAGGVAIPGTVGRLGSVYGVPFDPDAPPSPAPGSTFNVQAEAQNTLGVTRTSLALGMIAAPPQNPLPTIEMLPLNPGPAVQAGGSVILRARASIPSTTVNIARVEFYVNKVYVGFSTAVVAGTTDEYNYRWQTPSIAGSFEVSARAVSLNYTTPSVAPPFGLPGGVNFWASTISRIPVIVNTLQGTSPSVAITSPIEGGSLAINQTNLITATANVTGSSIRDVEFYANGDLVNTSSNVPFAVGYVPTSSGTYELFAIATARNGLRAVSPVVRATAATGRAPTVRFTAPTKQEITMPLGSLDFLWTANDEDGYVLKTEFFVNGAPFGGAFNGGSGAIRYSFPSQGRFSFFVRATDDAGNTADSSVIAVRVDGAFVDPNPIVNLNVRTFPETRYVIGSQLYFNGTATAIGTNTILTNAFFTDTGSIISATQTKITLGNAPVFASGIYTIASASARFIAAAATDSQGNVGFSEFEELGYRSPASPLPTVTMLPISAITPPSAGDIVELRASANFISTQLNANDTNRRVEFYANGALIGTALANTNTNSATVNTFTHSLQWLVPTNVYGDFSVRARAVQLNFNLVNPNTNVGGIIPYYSSVISLNSESLKIESVPGDLPTGSNGAFVRDMYLKLLYREPNYNEWSGLVAELDEGTTDRPGVVMTIMGFNESLKVFNRDIDYARTSASAMLPFARLKLTPTTTQVSGMINAMAADTRPLPIAGTSSGGGGAAGNTTVFYSGIPGAPWGATYGMANGMQRVVFASAQFRQAYRSVTGLDNKKFLDWLRSVMFPGRSGGEETKILDMMDAVRSDGLSRGAGAAFRSELAWVAVDGGYQIAPEQKFQLQAGTAMLRFQLTGVWSFTGSTPLYSRNVVQEILISAGYMTAPALSQSISFRPPSTVYAGRTYKLTARSSSTLPVTLSLQGSAGEASVVSSGPNTMTILVNRSGVINVSATQSGGFARGKYYAPATLPGSFTAVQK